jgi:predicted transposase/invertase (TIGR01784 family)
MTEKLPLTDNFLFKALFSQHEAMLLDLLNAFPEFQNKKRILKIKVLNPELPKASDLEKLSILDIHAEDVNGNKFLIEMQSQMEAGFEKRILYYWSQTYSKALKKGDEYGILPKIYSISFLDFDLVKNKKVHSVFQLREKDNPEILLTEDLEFHIIELKKLKEKLTNLKSDFDSWLYALKYGHTLAGEEMNTLVKKNPKLKKVFKEYDSYSSDPKNKSLLDARRKSQLYVNTQIVAAKKAGIVQGIERGIERGIEKKIVLNTIETVLKMLEKKASLDFISEVSGLAISEIIAIQKKHSKK